MTALGLEVACGLQACGEVTLTRRIATAASDEYGRPVLGDVPTTFKLLGPTGAEHQDTELRTQDRHQQAEVWKFWIIPQADESPMVFDELTWATWCFNVIEVKPLIVPCCNKQKIHHYEVRATRVQG